TVERLIPIRHAVRTDYGRGVLGVPSHLGLSSRYITIVSHNFRKLTALQSLAVGFRAFRRAGSRRAVSDELYFPCSGFANSASSSTRSAAAIFASVSTVGFALRA